MRTELGFGARGTFVAERQREQAGRPTAAETEKEKTVTGRFQMSLRTKKKERNKNHLRGEKKKTSPPFSPSLIILIATIININNNITLIQKTKD